MKPRSYWAILIVLPLLLAAFWLVLSNGGNPTVAAVHTLRADDEMLRLASETGFDAVVQVFSWLEIEPTQEEWHWEYPDFVVRAAEHYDLDLIVRLDRQPGWATEPAMDRAAPPDNLDDYAAFVGTVAQRYRGQIRGYIVWNEPNLAREWGGRPPDPAAYTDMLRRAYEAIKAADPEATVVSAGLASTNHQDAEAMNDRVFLEAMYQAGAGAYFDALGTHPYGFAYPPDDPQGAHDGLNLARLQDLRAIMEAHGDGDKPIWVTELGWTTAGVGEGSWLTVTPQQQADYLTGAWRRARQEWPWLQMFTVWNLSQGLPPTNEMAGYSLLDESGRPKPAYHALRAELKGSPSRWGHRLSRWVDHTRAFLPSPGPSVITILAADEAVHLGDSE